MRNKLIPLLQCALLCLASLHLLFNEDTYGLDIEPDFLYHPIAGLTIVDFCIFILAFISLFSKATIRHAFASRLLLGLLAVTLMVAYTNALFQGNLFGGGQGSGLKEIRAVIVMLCLYYVFRRAIVTLPDLLLFHMYFQRLVLVSAGICLARFALDINPLSTAATERLTAFEGPMLIWWVFCFSTIAGKVIEKPFGISAWVWLAIMALAVLFSYRRTPTYMLAIVLTTQLGCCMWSLRRAMYLIAVITAVCAVVLINRDSWLVSKLNPTTLFDIQSQEYSSNRASNVQHIDDIHLGWELAKKNPFLGVGPGAKLQSPDPLEELTVDTAIHMQYFNFWLRLGILGLLLILAYYGFIFRHITVVIRNVVDTRVRELALGIGGFVIASATVASLVGLNIYGTNKMQFLSIYIYSAAEILYLHRLKIVSTAQVRL